MQVVRRQSKTKGSVIMRAFLWAFVAAVAQPVLAHEYWIEPQKFHPAAATEIMADLRVGSDLSGEAFPWLRQSFRSVLFWPPGAGPVPVSGRMGDLPALRLSPDSGGLHRVSVETTPSFVIYDKPDTFPAYLEYEGLTGVIESHRARGLPETGFGERYVRNARALLQVGPVVDGQADAPTGMPFELVAEGNPYAAGTATIGVRLFWQGAPAADTQVALFFAPPGAARPDGVERSLFRTDADGRVTVPIQGAGLHLLSAVRIEPVDDSAAAVWQSWWASLSFAPGG